MQYTTKPYFWISSVYFIQGLPFAVINFLAVILYKDLSVTNASIAFFVSLFGLPWVLKPLWSPLTEVLGTKRQWILSMQLCMSVILLFLVISIPSSIFYYLSILLFLELAFCSATYDTVSDGYYLLTLDTKDQATYIGWRTLFYQLARIFCTGGIVVFSGWLRKFYSQQISWILGLSCIICILLILWFYHYYMLPHKEQRHSIANSTPIFSQVWQEFLAIENFGILLIYLATE